MGEAPYRDGLAAARSAVERRRTRARARRAEATAGRRRLPSSLREELDADEAVALEASVADRDELERVEAALDRYEVALDAALEMAAQRAVARRATRRQRLVRWAVGGVLALLACAWGWSVVRHRDAQRQRCQPSCEAAGRCHPRWTDVVMLREAACLAGSLQDCADVCRRAGLCSFDGYGCAARSDDDCRQSEACRDEGQCRLLRGGDVGMSHRVGRSMGTAGVCVIRTDEDCRSSRACTEHGRCVVGETACVAP